MPRPPLIRSTTPLSPHVAEQVAREARWRCPRCRYDLSAVPATDARVVRPECGARYFVTATLVQTLNFGAGSGAYERGDRLLTGCALLVLVLVFGAFILTALF